MEIIEKIGWFMFNFGAWMCLVGFLTWAFAQML